LLALLVFSTSVSAQTAATALITGTVTDQSGALVPGAEVEILDLGTNATRKVTCDENGVYRIVNVTPATYRITASAQGFKKATIQSIRIEVAKSYTVPFQLEVGDVASTIEVQAATSAEIQTTDATVGTAVGGTELLRLPTNNRSAATLLMLQPMVTPGRGVDNSAGGQVAGARSDQTTFLLDGGDSTSNTEGGGGYNTGFDGTPLPMIPVPVESIEEFRVGTTNPNASFGRSQGGQVALVTKRGTNSLHGSAYWYHQNDNLNANTWDNNTAGIPKAELKDNRYGFTLGGPIMKDKLFMFGHYEGRRFPRTQIVTRRVPLADLRNGILNFADGTGTVRQYNLLTSTDCGPAGGMACDPRGLGISPVIQSILNSLPQENTGLGGDGLNTRNYQANIDNTIKEEFFVVRLDYKITDKWDFFGSYRYAHTDTTGTQQVDITGISGCSAPCSTRQNPLEPRYVVFGVNGQISPKLLSETRFSWYRHWWQWGTLDPFSQVAGTAAAIQMAGEGLGNAGTKLLADPINIDTQNARSRVWNGKDTFVSENLTWLAGKHTVQFGGSFRNESIYHQRTDKVTGGLTGGPIFWTRSRNGSGGSFLDVGVNGRPPDCSTTITTFCLQSGDIARWNALYATVLGLVDQSAQILARDGTLNPLPLGTGVEAQVNIKAVEGYFQDVWRMSPSFTLNFGVTYQVQRPPTEELGRQTLPVFRASGEPVDLRSYYDQRAQAARNGQILNPEIAFSPIRSITSQEYVTEIDWNNVGPRVAFAWSPSYSDGWMGKLFGANKTAIRGGWGVTYTRMNGVGLVMTPVLGVGLSQVLSCNGPTSAGACNTGITTPASGFRVGPDGDGSNILPSTITPAAGQVPFPVAAPFGETRSFAIDPGLELGYSHSFDITWQRELPGDMLFEAGYVGRLGRNLMQNADMNSVPHFQVDPVSGQTLAQAFDAVAEYLRNGGAPAAVPLQPFFQNQVPAAGCTVGTPAVVVPCTQALATNNSTDFIVGDLGGLVMLTIDDIRFSNGLTPFLNNQMLINNITFDGGKSNYHAAFFTLRKRTSRGLAWDFNYTLATSKDYFGLNQENTAFSNSSPYQQSLDYAPSIFDVRHVFNAHWYYELPFGPGKAWSSDNNIASKIIGGWHIAGLFVGSSGVPLCVIDSSGFSGSGPNFGAPLGTGFCLKPTSGASFSNSRKRNVAGSAPSSSAPWLGTATFGGNSESNLFSDPGAVASAFRYPLLSQDTRNGFGELRGLPHWNVDVSIGKKTNVTEQIGIVFTFDFLNIFNHVEFNNPSADLANPGAFGVLDSQFGGTLNGPRRIQFGLRVEF
jgi:putative hemolysin